MTSSRLHVALSALALAGIVALAPACATRATPAAAPAPAPATAPPAGQSARLPTVTTVEVAPSAPPAPLLGRLTRDALRAYVPWQSHFVEPYSPDPAALAAIRANADGITVLLIVATWCPDSKREVPRFFAIMDGAGIRESQLMMVGVDRTKKDAEGLTDTWGVTRVPTFVFLRNGQEVGRVVERTPAGATLEGEIARVLAPRL